MSTYNTKVYHEQGGDRLVVADGGEIVVAGTFTLSPGATFSPSDLGLVHYDDDVEVGFGDDDDATLSFDGSSLNLDSPSTQLGADATQLLGFYGATPVDQPTALTAQLTPLTHTAPGTPDYAIQDLVNTSAYGFVTKDEGNTVLKVVANLQARLAEVEAILEELGLVAAN